MLWGVKLSTFLNSVPGSYYSIMLSEAPPPLLRQYEDTTLPLNAAWHCTHNSGSAADANYRRHVRIWENISNKLKQLKGADFNVQCVKITISKWTSNVWCHFNALDEGRFNMLRPYKNFHYFRNLSKFRSSPALLFLASLVTALVIKSEVRNLLKQDNHLQPMCGCLSW